MDQAHYVIQDQSDRLQAMARDEVTEVQEQAYNVYERKDVKTAEHVIAMNRLQLELRQMENAEMKQLVMLEDQHLRMQAFQEQQVQWQEH